MPGFKKLHQTIRIPWGSKVMVRPTFINTLFHACPLITLNMGGWAVIITISLFDLLLQKFACSSTSWSCL